MIKRWKKRSREGEGYGKGNFGRGYTVHTAHNSRFNGCQLIKQFNTLNFFTLLLESEIRAILIYIPLVSPSAEYNSVTSQLFARVTLTSLTGDVVVGVLRTPPPLPAQTNELQSVDFILNL